jgi:hypothetical protein
MENNRFDLKVIFKNVQILNKPSDIFLWNRLWQKGLPSEHWAIFHTRKGAYLSAESEIKNLNLQLLYPAESGDCFCSSYLYRISPILSGSTFHLQMAGCISPESIKMKQGRRVFHSKVASDFDCSHFLNINSFVLLVLEKWELWARESVARSGKWDEIIRDIWSVRV